LPTSWKETLSETLNLSKSDKRIGLPRICFIGVGNDLRGDDSAGLLVARALLEDESITSLPTLLVLEGGPAPENCTGNIRAFQPELVLLIDAVQMNEAPGTIQWVPLDAIDGMSASSHSLPLSILAQFIRFEFDCDTAILGIQPEQNEIVEKLSCSVRAAIDDVAAEISTFFYLPAGI
jgi:hydrogenase 3 maturation protease